MHELGIVTHVMKTLTDIAADNEVTHIGSVTLEVGEVSGVIVAAGGASRRYGEKNKLLEDINRNIESFTENINLSSGQIDENQKIIGTNNGKIHNLDAERDQLQKELASITEDIVTELDAKLKDAGYSSQANKAAKEELSTTLEKIKIFAAGRANIFKDFSALPNHTEKDSAKFSADAVEAFEELGKMLQDLSTGIENYTKTTPQFIDDFLSPEGIITKKRGIDNSIQDNISQINSIREENAELTQRNTELNKKIDEYKETLGKLRVNHAEMVQQINSCRQQIITIKKTLASQQAALQEQQEELFEENRHREDMEGQIESIDEEIAELQQRGDALANELKELDRQVADCNSRVSGKQNALQKKQEERNKYQAQLEKFSINIAQSETEIRNIKQNFHDNYSRDLMEYEERMYTITENTATLREKLSQTKQKITDLGQVNLMAVEQFAEEKDRYERQQESYNDTKQTLEKLVRVSEEIRTKSSEMFLDTYNKIRKNFHNMFRRLFTGGRAELRLVDPANVITTGIEIYAQPPGKKLENISLLSGGEKTMTALALLFATYQVRPSPFCLLDEIDAALDDKNVASFVTALRAFANVSQYIVITHNRKTAVGASSAIGVTMEESGISKVIAIRLDEKTSNGELTFDDEEGFVEEDVPEEEGIVIPPRPPRREHNPDGTLKEETKPEANSSAENSSQAEAPSATDNPAEAENPSATDTPAEADTPAVTDNSAQEESATSPEAEEKAENSSAEGKESESTANNGESSAEEGENPSEKQENPEEEQNN